MVKTTANEVFIHIYYYDDDNYCAYVVAVVVVQEADDNNNNMCHGHGTRTTLIAPPPDNNYPRLLLMRRRCRFPRGRVRARIINAIRTFGFFFLLFSFFPQDYTHTRVDTLTHAAIITQHYCDMGMCVDHCETFLFVSFFFLRFHSGRVEKNDKIK